MSETVAADDRPKEAPASRAGPTRASKRDGWWKYATLWAFAFAVVALLSFYLWQLLRPMALLVAAVVLAQAVAPVATQLARWLPRTLAVVTLYLIGLIVLFTAIWLGIPALVVQAAELLRTAPELVEQARGFVNDIAPGAGWLPGAIEPQVRSLALDMAGRVATVPFTIVSSFLDVVLIVVTSVYWLIAQPRMVEFTSSLFPPGQRERVEQVLGRIGQTIGAYVRAIALDALVIGVVSYVGLMIIGVPYPAALALISAFGEVVPIVGPFAAGAIAVAFALLESPQTALMVAIFYTVLQQIESNVLMPLIVKGQAQIPPVVIMVALVLGAALLGILGAIVAIPVAGALYVIAIDVIAPAIRQRTGATRA